MLIVTYKSFMLSVIVLNAVVLSVIMLYDDVLSAVAPLAGSEPPNSGYKFKVLIF